MNPELSPSASAILQQLTSECLGRRARHKYLAFANNTVSSA